MIDTQLRNAGGRTLQFLREIPILATERFVISGYRALISCPGTPENGYPNNWLLWDKNSTRRLP